jgi:hypothetical protein
MVLNGVSDDCLLNRFINTEKRKKKRKATTNTIEKKVKYLSNVKVQSKSLNFFKLTIIAKITVIKEFTTFDVIQCRNLLKSARFITK